jgi:cobalamin biosynthesis Mg chelatase CobN
MHVAMPELDGRIHGRAISFKQQGERDPLTEFAPVAYAPEPLACRGGGALAARWAKLRDTPAREKRVGIVLANYPTKTSRIGNGVGLDTPASVGKVFGRYGAGWLRVGDAPRSSDDLMALLLSKASARTPFADRLPHIFCLAARSGSPPSDRALGCPQRMIRRWSGDASPCRCIGSATR